MLHKIIAFMSEFHMIEPGESVVAGVSGGADSVCLFYLLLALREQIPFTLSVLHVNHGIRSDAGEDAEFVRELCRKHDIAFTLIEKDVPAYAAAHHLGEEEAGRRLRYEAFDRVNESLYGGGAKFAVAHNQNDRAETVLFQLFRGSGLHGMCGMKPVQGSVIRPLLCVTRTEIEAYLFRRGIAYRTDATNDGDDYARNRIRHHILRYAEQEICRGSTEHISRTADVLTQAADYLDAQTDGIYAACVKEDGTGEGLELSAEAFAPLHPYLKGSLIHRCFSRLIPAAKDIAAVHVDDVCALFEKQAGRRLTLPYGMTAQRTYQGVRMERGADGNSEPDSGADGSRASGSSEPGSRVRGSRVRDGEEAACDEAQVLLEGESGEVRFGGYRFSFRVFSCEDGKEILKTIPKNNCTKWFDYDRIKKPVAIRYRRTGDDLVINAAGNTQSLKKYMINEKIPSAERARIPLAAEGSHVLWVAGYRISEAYKVTADTKRVIEIYMSGGKENG